MVLPADPGDGGQPASARRPNGRVNHMLAHCHNAGGGHGASSPPGLFFCTKQCAFFCANEESIPRFEWNASVQLNKDTMR